MSKSFPVKGFRKKIAALLCFTLISVSIMAISPFGTLVVNADATTQNNALRIVSQYKGTFTSVPTWSNAGQTSDAPLLGNGDLGVRSETHFSEANSNSNFLQIVRGKNYSH